MDFLINGVVAIVIFALGVAFGVHLESHWRDNNE